MRGLIVVVAVLTGGCAAKNDIKVVPFYPLSTLTVLEKPQRLGATDLARVTVGCDNGEVFTIMTDLKQDLVIGQTIKVSMIMIGGHQTSRGWEYRRLLVAQPK